MKKTILLLATIILIVGTTITVHNHKQAKYQTTPTFDTFTVPQSQLKKIKFFSQYNDITEVIDNENINFAMNGGIFSEKQKPMGLYIENSQKIQEPDLSEGEGNFYLKPNGIFLITDQKSQILETSKYQEQENISFALQSGPLLIENNQIHPSFNPTSSNTFIRNGVGIDQDGNTIFAISNKEVNLHQFASFFRDQLNCPNALYLDGTISEMYIKGQRKHNEQDFATIITF